MQYNERIRSLREDADEKQETVARILGITRQQYGLYETGQRQFKIEHLIILCQHYVVSADYILDLPKGLSWPKH